MTEIDIDDLKEELLQCRRCGICRNAVYEDKGFDGICPIWRNTSGFETSFMRGKIQVALALIDGVLERTALMQNPSINVHCVETAQRSARQNFIRLKSWSKFVKFSMTYRTRFVIQLQKRS